MKLKVLTDRVADEHNYIKKDVHLLVQTFLDILGNEITEKGRVYLRGFGTFRIVETAPRMVKNPKTGRSVAIPPKRRVRFKAALPLQRRLST
jgi:integration host factor subunit beta